MSQFSTAGCADGLIALVGHGTRKCVITSDTSLVVVFRLAVVVVGVAVVRFLDLELF